MGKKSRRRSKKPSLTSLPAYLLSLPHSSLTHLYPNVQTIKDNKPKVSKSLDARPTKLNKGTSDMLFDLDMDEETAPAQSQEEEETVEEEVEEEIDDVLDEEPGSFFFFFFFLSIYLYFGSIRCKNLTH